jgi:hypothetical protein
VNIAKHIKNIAKLILLCLLAVSSCTIKYSFTGASIPPDAKTFSVQFFQNVAPLVIPTLSPEFTDALKDKMLRGTRLSQVDEDGDLNFEGEITGYDVAPKAITAGEVAEQNRLTISARVKFTNETDPNQNFDKTFSQYVDYSSNLDLSSLQDQLIAEILEKLMEDIFNAAVANW